MGIVISVSVLGSSLCGCGGLALFLAFATLECRTKRFVLVKVFLLALDVAVHDDAAIVAHDMARLEAAWTDCKVRLDILAGSDLIRHQVLIVLGVWVGTQIHQEPSNILSASHSCKVKRCVALLVCNVWLSSMFEKQLEDLVTTVMTGSLQKWCTLVCVHLVDISVSDDQPLANIRVLLHTGQSQRAFTAVGNDPRICTESQEQSHNLQMIID